MRGFFAAILLLPAGLRGAIVLNEIHYNPPEGGQLEFIEIHNTDPLPVELGGWSFTNGIRFVFPEDAIIEGNGFVVVCQNRAEVAAAFALPPASLLGDFSGSLDNGGELVTLTDARGIVVDEVAYDDDPPWDADADGPGASLERACADFDATHPGNWRAEKEGGPTPLAENRLVQCPPPEIPPPEVAINEIHYHPLDDEDAKEEYIELLNTTAAPIQLRGYAFASGIEFSFDQDLVLEPGGIVLVCRDRETMEGLHGARNAVGNFTGQLSNDGERVSLVNPAGILVDSVRYGDDGDWPVAADGLGFSLERINPVAVSDDPANWKEAELAQLDEWRHVNVAAVATSSRLLVYLDGAGEFLIDNVSIEDPASPGVNFLPNGTFDAGLEPWIASGNHADTTWDTTGGPDGSGAMRLVAGGRGTGVSNGLVIDTVPELVRITGPTYKLSFDYKYVTGSKGLTFRISGSSTARGIYWQLGSGTTWSPGLPNSSFRERLPPFVSRVSRFPEEPGSSDPVWITARVRAAGSLRSVKVHYALDGAGEPTTIDLRDDGASQDGLAADGVYGAMIPAAPHNTIVTYRIGVDDEHGVSRVSPPESDPTGVHGYYVNDLRPQSNLPVFTLLLNHTSPNPPRSLITALDCSTYRTASFAYRGDLYYNVGIRERGQSVCNSTKPFLKVRFQRGRDFEGLRKLNLQSLWTDKSLIREHISWGVFEDVGMPSCRQEFVRLHANGKYFGLYARLEHPDQRFLERNRLNAEGNLYKATASREEVSGVYEKKTNEDGDFSDLREFLTQLHSTQAVQLTAFFSEKVDEDRMIDYQLAQVLTNNSDYPHKNHYLYHDTERGRWMPLTWDMDLTFGKIWDGTYGGVLHDKMHNPGITPWYTTNVDGAGGGNHLLDKFFSQAGTWYRRAYLVRLFDALREKYTEEFFEEKIAGLRDLLFDEQVEDIAAWGRSPATADDPTAPRDFDPNLQRVRDHIRIRRAFLINYLATRSRFTEHDSLKITEVLYNPAGSGEELEFLELWNSTGKEIDVTGWSIEGIGFIFPDGTLVGEDEIIVVAKDPAAFRAMYGDSIRVLGPYEGQLDNDGEILRVKDAGPGYPATVDFLRYSSSDPWPREADGLGYSIELTDVSAARDNDLGVYWRASAAAGGTPGSVEGIGPGVVLYRRGDPNSDGAMNVTDALVILRYLFQGLGEPACLASADVDGDGSVKDTDAIYLLRYLFQGSTDVIPSPGPGECAPVPEGTCATPNCER
jgi:hypothetical protein